MMSFNTYSIALDGQVKFNGMVIKKAKTCSLNTAGLAADFTYDKSNVPNYYALMDTVNSQYTNAANNVAFKVLKLDVSCNFLPITGEFVKITHSIDGAIAKQATAVNLLTANEDSSAGFMVVNDIKGILNINGIIDNVAANKEISLGTSNFTADNNGQFNATTSYAVAFSGLGSTTGSPKPSNIDYGVLSAKAYTRNMSINVVYP